MWVARDGGQRDSGLAKERGEKVVVVGPAKAMTQHRWQKPRRWRRPLDGDEKGRRDETRSLEEKMKKENWGHNFSY